MALFRINKGHTLWSKSVGDKSLGISDGQTVDIIFPLSHALCHLCYTWMLLPIIKFWLNHFFFLPQTKSFLYRARIELHYAFTRTSCHALSTKTFQCSSMICPRCVKKKVKCSRTNITKLVKYLKSITRRPLQIESMCCSDLDRWWHHSNLIDALLPASLYMYMYIVNNDCSPVLYP